jgi:hypothetical protein
VLREMINCEGVVHGSLRAPQGAVVGGSIRVGGDVDVAALGSPGGTRTELQLGSVPLLEPRLAEFQALFEQLLKAGCAIDPELAKFSSPGRILTPADKERMTQLTYERGAISERLLRCDATRMRLESTVSALRTVNVTVRRMLHANVVLVVGERAIRVHADVKGPLRILRDRGGQLLYRRTDTGAGGPIARIAECRAA